MRPDVVGMRSLWSFGLIAITLLSAPFPTLRVREHLTPVVGKLEGRIRDTGGVAIPSAQVRIDGTAYGAVADSRGYWFINNVPAGTIDLTATFVGFKRVQVKGLVIKDGVTTVQDFALEAIPIDITDLEIAGSEVRGVPRNDGITTSPIRTGLTGSVTTRSGRPIVGATVEASGIPAVVTDSLGHFALETADGKKIKLKVTAVGYRPLELTVDKLTEGQTRRLTLRMQD